MFYLLRHGCRNERVHSDSQFYVTIAALLKWLNKDLRHHLDTEDISKIVANNDKVRFSIDTIRGVKSNIIENKRYKVLETYCKNLPKILTEGLSRMDRKNIHLCKQIGGTWIRRNKRANIVIYIDAQEAGRNLEMF